MTDKLQINNVIEAVLEEHVAATRSQRVQIRELLLDAIEQAGFFIGENVRSGSDNVGTRPQPNDYARPDYCSEDGTRYIGPSALDEDDEDIQSLMDRDRE